MTLIESSNPRDRRVALGKGMTAKIVRASRRECEESLTEFCKGAWSSVDSAPYSENWAVRGLCDHLEAVTMGHIKRLIVNMPPRCQKTLTLSVFWPAWTWCRERSGLLDGPQVKFLCGSYNDRLSLESATLMRQLLTSPWYQMRWGDRFSLRQDKNMKSNFANTEGGERISVSIGGSLLGLGGDIAICDDPHNTENVESQKERESAARWWAEFHSTRLNNPIDSAVVLGMQRLHSEDLSGIAMSNRQEDWVQYCIPMRHDARRHCVTVVLPQYVGEEPWEDERLADGELMWPERFNEAAVRERESALGPYMASGRLQQQPVPRGGGIIKEDWWQCWDHDEAQRYGLEWTRERKEFPEYDEDLVTASLDTSMGEKQENDYNALTVWGFWTDKAKNRRVMLLYGWNKRLPLHGTVISAERGEAKINFDMRQEANWGLIEWVAHTCKKYKVKRLLIEDKTRGKDVANEIKRLYARESFGVELLNPVKDKEARANSVVPMFTDRMIWAPETQWSADIITECSLFPKGPHDDYVDSVTQFLIWARKTGLAVRADEASAEMDEMKLYRGRQESVADQYGV